MIHSNILLSIFCLLFLTVYSDSSFLPKNPPRQCLALCLEGGGDAGAWQAGVLSGFISLLPPESIQYDVISGVSVGAINGLYISTFDKGDEKNMIQSLLTHWRTIERSDVFQPWDDSWIKTIEVLYNKPSLLDNSPLKKSLEQYLVNNTIKRKMTIAVTDATNAEVLNFDIDQLEKDQISERILQSTSMPAVFPYQIGSDNTTILMDGGVMMMVDVHSAVRRCKELGFQESEITLDAILPTGANIDKIYANKSYSGYDIYERYKQITRYMGALDDMLHAINDFPDVNFRHIVFPLEDIPRSTIPIFFDKASIEKMIQLGEQDASKIINKPDQVGLNEVIKRKKQRIKLVKTI